jgi:hypothetical protein
MDHQNVNGSSNSIEQEPAQASSEAGDKAGARATKMEAAKALFTLRGFIGHAQLKAIDAGAWSEERQFFFDKLVELGDRVATMPKTYEQDGKGEEAIAYLHYFIGACDWYITEKDAEAEQLQAFGLADLGYGAELGYIAITELIKHGAELDMYFTPATLASIKAKD